MSQPSPSLVGAVVERNAASSTSRAFVGSAPSTGFPSVQHRSKSAFARNRDSNRRTTSNVPVVERSTVKKGLGDDLAEREQSISAGSYARACSFFVMCYQMLTKITRRFCWSTLDLLKHCESQVSVYNYAIFTTKPKPDPASTPSRIQPDTIPDASTEAPDDGWRGQMSSENARMVEEMTEEEREKHRTEILDQLGPDVASLIRKAQEKRQSSTEGTFTSRVYKMHA